MDKFFILCQLIILGLALCQVAFSVFPETFLFYANVVSSGMLILQLIFYIWQRN